MKHDELVKIAAEAMKNSYSIYSGYTVGAALLCKSGKVFTGCNIENSSYSPTVCAERVAFFKAISEGEREFASIAVVGGKNFSAKDYFTPCGVCRQVMLEFCDKDTFTVVFGKDDGYEVHTLSELIPFSFGKESLK